MFKHWVLVMAVGLVSLGACGDDTSDGNGGNSEGGSNAGGGTPDTEVNGCKRSAADDRTADAEVELDWTLTHQECIVVAAGTKVTWNGDFLTHPLLGGETPEEDDSSPISASDGTTSSVIFASPGVFPYFCNAHFDSMQGVIYVE